MLFAAYGLPRLRYVAAFIAYAAAGVVTLLMIRAMAHDKSGYYRYIADADATPPLLICCFSIHVIPRRRHDARRMPPFSPLIVGACYHTLLPVTLRHAIAAVTLR